MSLEKKLLSLEDIESQTALELPDRETPVTVVIGCLGVCVGQIRIRDVTVEVAATVCAGVQALNNVLSNGGVANLQLTCETRNNP